MHTSDFERRRIVFDARVGAHDAAIDGYREIWQRWRTRLLAIGGVEVVPPLEPEYLLVALLESGIAWSGDAAICVPGRPSACHENVAGLVAAGATECGHVVAAGWTGYALSGDGLWRQHSWAEGAQGVIIETTAPRLAYVGVRRSGPTVRT